MGGRDGGQGFGGSKGNAGASPLSFVLFFFGLDSLMLVVCVCFFPLTLLRFCLDTRLPGESRDNAARGDALVSKSDCLVVDEQSGR